MLPRWRLAPRQALSNDPLADVCELGGHSAEMAHALLIQRSCENDLAEAFANELSLASEERLDVVRKFGSLPCALVKGSDGLILHGELLMVGAFHFKLSLAVEVAFRKDLLLHTKRSFIFELLDLLPQLVISQVVAVVESHHRARPRPLTRGARRRLLDAQPGLHSSRHASALEPRTFAAHRKTTQHALCETSCRVSRWVAAQAYAE